MAPMGLPERDRPAVPAEFCGATVALGARGRWVRSDQCPDPAPLGAPLDWQWRQWGCRNGTGRRCRRNFVGQRWHWGLGCGGPGWRSWWFGGGDWGRGGGGGGGGRERGRG